MITLRRCAVLSVAFLVAGVMAWRVIVMSLADRFASVTPERALALEPHHPGALLALAQRELKDQHPHEAMTTARELLRYEPLEGRAFSVLAAAAEQVGDIAQARTFYEIAVRRDPRDLHSRAWITEALLREGRYDEALVHINILLRISPGQGSKLFPVLVQLADAPEFAQALTRILRTQPAWREGMLSELLTRGSLGATAQVFGALQREGDLSIEEGGHWLDCLMTAGLWGEAYSRWVSGLAIAPGEPLPVVYNGGFETEPTNSGFDWRISNSAGVTIGRVPVIGATGAFAMRVTFSGRRVPQINFEQTLLLAPGTYLLHFRARAQALRSDKGLQWAIGCQGDGAPLAVSSLLEGSFDWKQMDTPFVIPAKDCPAQRLWLHNPGAAAAGKTVSGEVWIDDVSILASTVPR